MHGPIFPLIASHLAFCALIVEIDRSIDPEGLFSFPMDIKFKYFPGKSSQVLNKGWFFELPKSNGKNLTFNTFVMHRLTVFQEIQEEIFNCFSKISMFEK